MIGLALSGILALTIRSATAMDVDTAEQFTVVHVSLVKDDLKLIWKSDKSAVSTFENLATLVKSRHRKLVFAMNAGMFMTDFSPLGLYIENGKLLRPLNTRSGKGNFYLKPNGVFFVKRGQAAVETTDDWLSMQDKNSVSWATQSGPMLLVNGKIHSGFNQTSANKLFRNGVCADQRNQIHFAISDVPVNFYEMALFFKDHLKCTSALYLDGTVSRLMVDDHSHSRFDPGSRFGPMFYISAP